MNKRNPRVGFLPLYLKLYDDSMGERRKDFDPLLEAVNKHFVDEGFEVTAAPVCRVREEFEAAVASFKAADVDIIATLHLAYSPSLESAQVLAESNLPIVMVDTTLSYDFGLDVGPEEIFLNHGIHGLQDLASMLRRFGKPFEIVAGHLTESDVLDRASAIICAAHGARAFSSSKALRIGESFKGMGDFYVEA
ncbi:MAG: hypothetical protein ACYTGH_18535, partial [Planctomycetota bacterium]